MVLNHDIVMIYKLPRTYVWCFFAVKSWEILRLRMFLPSPTFLWCWSTYWFLWEHFWHPSSTFVTSASTSSALWQALKRTAGCRLEMDIAQWNQFRPARPTWKLLVKNPLGAWMARHIDTNPIWPARRDSPENERRKLKTRPEMKRKFIFQTFIFRFPMLVFRGVYLFSWVVRYLFFCL